MIRTLRISVLCLLLLSLAAPALAHRVSIYAWVENGQIHTQSRFSKKKPVKSGTVDVMDAATGDIILSGPVTEEGIFVFDIPKDVLDNPRDLTLVVNAGEGHKGDWKIEAAELGTAPAPEQAQTADTTSAQAAPQTSSQMSAQAGVGLSKAELEQVLNTALEQKLAPIRRHLAESEDAGPGLTEIIGGIGWLLGLAGIAAWFASRKR